MQAHPDPKTPKPFSENAVIRHYTVLFNIRVYEEHTLNYTQKASIKVSLYVLNHALLQGGVSEGFIGRRLGPSGILGCDSVSHRRHSLAGILLVLMPPSLLVSF